MDCSAQQTVLAIDVGGTKIRYGLVTLEGGILAQGEYPTQPMKAPAWCAMLIETLDAFLDVHQSGCSLLAIGIGVKGSVDHRLHRLRSSSVVLEAADYDICGKMQGHFHVPVYLENDVKASALRELLFGIGREKSTFACINVGTGLAMGLILDGELVSGIHNNAGEIGNLLYHRLDDGSIGCLETVSSGRGLEQEAQRLRSRFPESLLLNGSPPKGRTLVRACREGDPAAGLVIQNMIHHLALTLINLDTAMDIGTYVVVGGVMADPWMFHRLTEEIHRIASQIDYNIFGWHADIVISDAGADLAGVIGAASIAFYQSKHKKYQ